MEQRTTQTKGRRPRVYLAAIPQDGPDYPARMYQDESGKWVREVRNFFSGEYIRRGTYLSSERAQIGGLEGMVRS